MVVVRGMGFQNLTELVCKFGCMLVEGSLMDGGGEVHCMSPSAKDACVGGLIEFDFTLGADWSGVLTLYGGMVDEGYLKLTTNDFEQRGAAIMQMQGMQRMEHFDASFKVWLGGGSGGEGLAFCVGNLPTV